MELEIVGNVWARVFVRIAKKEAALNVMMESAIIVLAQEKSQGTSPYRKHRKE